MLKVECESCKAPYQIDERRVPKGGLKMRCPKCGHSFVVQNPNEPAAAVTPIAKPSSNGAEWRLSGIHSLLSVEAEVDGKLETYRVDNADLWLFVRAVTEPRPHFEIFRMEIHEAAAVK